MSISIRLQSVEFETTDRLSGLLTPIGEEAQMFLP